MSWDDLEEIELPKSRKKETPDEEYRRRKALTSEEDAGPIAKARQGTRSQKPIVFPTGTTSVQIMPPPVPAESAFLEWLNERIAKLKPNANHAELVREMRKKLDNKTLPLGELVFVRMWLFCGGENNKWTAIIRDVLTAVRKWQEEQIKNANSTGTA